MLPIAALDKLTYADLERMVEAGLQEGRALDFKRDAAGRKDDDKREFLADVSAFANTVGGDLVFGIDETDGRATAIPGIAVNPDDEVRRLDDILRSNLEPRLARHELRWVEPPAGKQGILICRVPRSFAAPHRVTFRDHAKFYARSSAGKYAMDTSELRAAFLAGDSLVEQVRRFRLDRLSVIEAGEGAMPLMRGPLAVLHVVPLSSFASRNDIVIGEYGAMLLPPSGGGGGSNPRHTLEGFATYQMSYGAADPEASSAYVLLFRSGIIEAAFSIEGNNPDYLAASMLEWPILRVFLSYLVGLRQHGLEPPYYVFLSLLGVRSYRLVFGSEAHVGRFGLNRARLIVPSIIIDEVQNDVDPLLRPMFDMVWNAFGMPRALTFNPAGKYVGATY